MIEAEEDMRRTLAGVGGYSSSEEDVLQEEYEVSGHFDFIRPVTYTEFLYSFDARFNPTSINVDFEQSAIRAIRDAFPDAPNSEDSKIAGCFFTS
uniref:Uncharacterized protein n=1 Tax=Ditylenchus dipsaci TaxID=166011 RepID=A0A915ECU6_9BILA